MREIHEIRKDCEELKLSVIRVAKYEVELLQAENRELKLQLEIAKLKAQYQELNTKYVNLLDEAVKGAQKYQELIKERFELIRIVLKYEPNRVFKELE